MKAMRVLLVRLVYLQRLDHTESFGLGDFGHVVQRYDQFLRYSHDAREKADVVLCYIHSTLVKDTFRISTAKIIKDDLLLR